MQSSWSRSAQPPSSSVALPNAVLLRADCRHPRAPSPHTSARHPCEPLAAELDAVRCPMAALRTRVASPCPPDSFLRTARKRAATRRPIAPPPSRRVTWAVGNVPAQSHAARTCGCWWRRGPCPRICARARSSTCTPSIQSDSAVAHAGSPDDVHHHPRVMCHATVLTIRTRHRRSRCRPGARPLQPIDVVDEGVGVALGLSSSDTYASRDTRALRRRAEAQLRSQRCGDCRWPRRGERGLCAAGLWW